MRNCKECKKEFEERTVRHRFCSEKCYINNYMKKNNYMSQYFIKRKGEIFIKLDKKCNHCNLLMTEFNFLSFDLHHKNGRKDDNKLSLYVLSADFNINEVILLCTHCHRKYHTKEETFNYLKDILKL